MATSFEGNVTIGKDDYTDYTTEFVFSPTSLIDYIF